MKILRSDWECDGCGDKGYVEYTEESNFWVITLAVVAAHKARSPECAYAMDNLKFKGGEDEMREPSISVTNLVKQIAREEAKKTCLGGINFYGKRT